MARTFRIGMQIEPVDPFWVQVREAVIQRAKQLGLHLVQLALDYPAYAVDTDQRALIDELQAQELDALIISGLNDELTYRILAHGIFIINLSEASIQHPHYLSTRGLYGIGQMLGDFVVQQLPNGGSVLMVGGLIDHFEEDGSSRIAGIRAALAAYPDIQLRHIPSGWRYEDAYNQITATLQHHPLTIDAIVGLSDSLALAARDAYEDLGVLRQHTLTVGINGDPFALAAIAEGRMMATVETSAADLGCQAVDVVCQFIEHQPLPPHISYKPRLVTAQNVAEVAMQKLIAIADLPKRLVGVNRQLEQQRLAQLEISLEINRRVGAILDRQQISHEIADRIRANYGYDLVQILLWSETEQLLILDQPASAHRSTIPLADAGVLGQALLRNTAIFIPDARYSHRFPPDPRWPHTLSRVVVPIRLAGNILGLLDLHSSHATQHSHHELISLQSLADQLGVAIRNAELYSDALKAQALAEKADMLKTRLLANVSHELRTPLNVIMGHSQVALSQREEPLDHVQVARQDLQQIYRSGEHLIRLINDLLDLSRAEIDELNLYPEVIDTRAFLQEVFGSIASHNQMQNDVVWRLCLPERLPFLQADPVRLRQIIFNLLANARKCTPAGQITLGAEVLPPYIHFWVADTGIGISIDMQERIFEPFVSEEPAGRRPSGIGLGLSITRQLVMLHYGWMSLESQPGHGSTFHVYVPLPNMQGLAPTSRQSARPAVLVISAQQRPVPALLELCHRQGLALHQLQPGDDPRAALQTVQPVALAWDLANAGPNDWSMIERLRSYPECCQIPFMLYGEAADDALGMTNVLTKPLSGKNLLEIVLAMQPDVAGPILIVDDDPETCAMYQKLLAHELPGYNVQIADGGAAALAILAQQTPSLVILDLMMPEIDGFTVLERIRSHRPTRDVPVLVISGHLLSFEDIRRLSYARVTLHSKEILSADELAAGIRQALSGEEALPEHTSALVKRAIVYIHQHYTQAIELLSIAEAVGVSRDYLGRIFHQELGLSPWDYLLRCRIRRARQLLRETNLSISAIAVQVGFDDPSYFGRVFRKEVGCSPRQYREHPIGVLDSPT